MRSETLRLMGTPDVVRVSSLAIGTGCGPSLGEDAPVLLHERRQVHELSRLRLAVREHRALPSLPHAPRMRVRCCGAAAVRLELAMERNW